MSLGEVVRYQIPLCALNQDFIKGAISISRVIHEKTIDFLFHLCYNGGIQLKKVVWQLNRYRGCPKGQKRYT